MIHRIALTVAAGLVAALPATAQTRAELKRELKDRESAITEAEQVDTAALVELANWAREQGLMTDHKRLLNKVLAIEPENAAALEGLGYVFYEGEWMAASKVEILERQKLEDAYRAKGFEQVDGVWVPPDEVADAKRGVFHHDGQVVSRDEKQAFLDGKVRHPATAEFIDASFLPKAEQGLFPLADGEWGDREAADAYHSDPAHPWFVRTERANLVTTLPWEQHAAIAALVDDSIATVEAVFGRHELSPSHRPTVLACATTDEYRNAGTTIGAEYSAHGAFPATQAPNLPGVSFPVLPGVANCGAPQGWGDYYVRHAAGLAYVNAIEAEHGTRLPLWLVCGAGALAERHFNEGVAKWFAQQHLQKGGIDDLKGWFAGFDISGNLSTEKLDYNVFQAGLVLSYAVHGGNEEVSAALRELVAAVRGDDGAALRQAAQDLEKALLAQELGLREYLRQLVQG